MTKRQQQVLSFVRKFWEKNNHSPSYREIANEMGTHPSNAYRIIRSLTDDGFLYTPPGRARSIYPPEVWASLRGKS